MKCFQEHVESSETCIAVPDWQTLELSKPVLNRLRCKSLFWFKEKLRRADGCFNEQRCENFDIVATYRPYHFNNREFGQYIYIRYFMAFLLHILETTRFSLREAHSFALNCVQAHGAFHHLIERFAEWFAPSSYLMYKREVYCHCWGTEECFEETLANVYVFLNHPKWEEPRVGYLRQLFALQRGGYAQAATVTELNLSVLFSRLEAQITRQDSVLGSHLLEQWIMEKTPFDAEALPVYLVNDGLEDSEFEKILELFFPACLELS